MAHSFEDIRNVALLGHGSTGKSAFIDAVALKTKVSARRGDSSDGSLPYSQGTVSIQDVTCSAFV